MPKRTRSAATRSSSDIREAALAYAAQGWPVLACYTNTPEGCSCGDSKCLSPGKHPKAKLSPKGVQSATTDLDEIASWPKKINIGIALGHGNLMALDVDDAEVAAALLAPDAFVETAVARTGRGVHVYFLCSGEHKTQHLRDKESGRKIGHIAGLGTYTIAPPSRAPGGKLYKWLSTTERVGWIPTLVSVSDAQAYVKKLLLPYGFRAVPTASVDIENIPDTEIEECDLVDISKRLTTDSTLLTIKQKLKGVVHREQGARDAEKDLSGWEHALACQIVRAAKSYKNITYIDPLILAGIIKKLDRMHYGKFESDVELGKRSRAGADKRYLIAAMRALDAENMRTKPRKKRIEAAEPLSTLELDTDTDDDIIGIVDEPSYYWDEDTKRLYHLTYHKKSTGSIRIANFNVKLLSEILVDKDDAVPDRAWVVEFTSPFGEVKKVSLRASEFKNTHALEEALTHKLSHEFIVSHVGHGHLKPAILELTKPEEVQRFSIRAVPGWWSVTNDDGEEERVYLLPSALGAISKRGLLPELQMRM